MCNNTYCPKTNVFLLPLTPQTLFSASEIGSSSAVLQNPKSYRGSQIAVQYSAICSCVLLPQSTKYFCDLMKYICV